MHMHFQKHFLAVIFATSTLFSFAIDTKNTRMLSSPAISDNHLVFAYANDLWVANKDGSNPVRLTISQGDEMRPSFSPDGSMVAFTGSYDGNTDVFVVPTAGGIPKRLTYHPGGDYALEFTPDGKSILFISQREVFTNRYLQFFTVNIETGEINKLEIPNGFKGSFSPDGKFLAYTPIADRFNQWKNYRGGTASRIWIFDFEDKSVVEVPKPEGGCNDSDPMWYNGMLYFNSDRKGEFNLFSYDLASKSVQQHTDFKDFPIKNPRVGNNGIVFEHAGYIYFMDSDDEVLQIKVGISTDLLEVRPRYVSGPNWLRWYNISPSGVRAVMTLLQKLLS